MLNRELLDQLDTVRNARLRPESLRPGSHMAVWWRCEKGHVWRAEVKSRTSGSGCPYCVNRAVLSGENDLATTHPRLAAQWDDERNATLRPDEVVSGSHKRVWWRCEKGHSWQAPIYSRALGGAGCPVCAGKLVLHGVNDLASQFPQLAAEWDAERNGELGPEQVTPSSNRRVWWRCKEGHSWQAVIASRARLGCGCPYCAGRKVLPGFNDLATRFPRLAEQWDAELNKDLSPRGITSGSSRRVWWRCSASHVWRAAVYSRTGPKKCGCPICGER